MASLLVGCNDTSSKNQKTESSSSVSSVPGCNSQGQSDQHNPHCTSEQKSPKVVAVSLDGAKLVITGENLSEVKELRIQIGDAIVSTVIKSKEEKRIQASPLTPLALISGAIYKLLVSSANAEQQVPVTISVTLPNLSVNAACSNANKLTFAGYTAVTNANLRSSLKGGNALCEAAFPGSHWANKNEIMSLGANYPWTENVWIHSQVSIEAGQGFANLDCNQFTTDGVGSGTECKSNPDTNVYQSPGSSTASTLDITGRVRFTCCNAFRALACVK